MGSAKKEVVYSNPKDAILIGKPMINHMDFEAFQASSDKFLPRRFVWK